MMDLDEAIRHAEEVAEKNEEIYEAHCRIYSKEVVEKYPSPPCKKCADEHRQLAEWLKELKAYREQGGDAISRKYILDLIATKGANLDDDLLIVEQWIQDAPSVNPHPIECGDAISRQAALDIITFEDKWLFDANGHNANTHIAFSGLESRVKALPSVTPQQRTGRWIQKEEEGDAEPFIIWECSECHCVDEDGKPSYKYCPQCGAKMEVEE